MNLESKESTSVVFSYIFQTICDKSKTSALEIPVEIPFQQCIPEFISRIITNFHLPCYVEPDLDNAFRDFISEKTNSYHDCLAREVVDEARSGGVEDVIKWLERAYKEEMVDYAEKRGISDSEVFSRTYHKLVHSGNSLQTMLQVEQSYAVAVSQTMMQMNEEINALTARQMSEMNEALTKTASETNINNLISKHFEHQNLLQGKWNSEVDTLKETQRREYRSWLMKLLEEQQMQLNAPICSPIDIKKFPERSEEISKNSRILEESFTIHLGSQMKQMHNIRIISANILDLCAENSREVDLSPQRLQTALQLYSNDLCGLVLLNEGGLNYGFSSISKEFSSLCDSSTEFHFQNITDQLEHLRNEVGSAISWRNSSHHPGNLTISEQESRRSASKNLQVGDVFVTKHSNLASVHIVFHMLVDDTLRSSDMNSRHSSILGLRNILKIACSNDVTTLTIPVLLMHEMTEEMTVAWCTKRAELVFKCVKGFMIEMASWGGSELKNLQFLVPKGISDEVFSSLATMLPSIFRVSNTVVLKPSTPTK